MMLRELKLIDQLTRERDDLRRQLDELFRAPDLSQCRNAHIFNEEGICIRCGEDAEEWDAGCVEEWLTKLENDRQYLANALLRAIKNAERYNVTADDLKVLEALNLAVQITKQEK